MKISHIYGIIAGIIFVGAIFFSFSAGYKTGYKDADRYFWTGALPNETIPIDNAVSGGYELTNPSNK